MSNEQKNAPHRSIVIDLRSTTSAGALLTDQLVQQDAIAQFDDLLTQACEEARQHQNQNAKQYVEDGHNAEWAARNTKGRKHTAILLHGGRGSGKTTLLKSLIHGIAGDSGSNSYAKQSTRLFKTDTSSVQFLDIIDPNLLETKDNLLVLIIGLIKAAVERKTVERKQVVTATPHEWQESLRRLSGGLSRLDRIGKETLHDEDWDDAMYVMEKGLQKASDSIGFETYLHDFIDKSLSILRKDLFVLAFDDIDTASHRGWEVLEVIRKYLATPALQVVISGDLELYSKVVRLEHWKKFDNDAMALDGGSESYRPQVSQLEDQYMLKLLDPTRRIGLRRLSDILSGKTSIHIKLPSSETLITEMIDQAVTRHFSVRRSSDLRLYRSLVLRQPIRTILQFLQAFQLSNSGRDAFHFHQALADIALGALIRRNISPEQLALARYDPQRYFSLIRSYLTSADLWAAGHRLRPDVQGESDDDNLLILALSAPLTAAIREDPSLLFDYLIKVALAHSAADYVPQDSEQGIEKYLSFVSRRLSEDSRTEVGQNVAVVVGLATKDVGSTGWNIRQGIIRVISRSSKDEVERARQRIAKLSNFSNLEEHRKIDVRVFEEKLKPENTERAQQDKPEKLTLGVTHNTVQSLQDRIMNPLHKGLAGLPFCEVANRATSSTSYLSIFNILGALSALTVIPTDDSTEEDRANKIAEAFTNVTQMRTYPAPNWVNYSSEKRTERQEDDSIDEEEEDIPDSSILPTSILPTPFLTVMACWQSALHDALKSGDNFQNGGSIHLFARIWSRFYFTIAGTTQTIPEKEQFLGWVLHRQIIAFLSAILTEEATDRDLLDIDQASGSKSKIGISLVNPTRQDRPFLGNLGTLLELTKTSTIHDVSLDKIGARLPIFGAIFACPIWGMYLFPRQCLQKEHGNINLLEVQIRCWAKWCDVSDVGNQVDEAKRLLEVSYSSTKNNASRSNRIVQFDNLFDPLSSILIAKSS